VVDEPVLLKERDGGVLTLTLNRPESMNAFTNVVLDDLFATLRAAHDDSEVRCLVITGAGERAFSAGADVKAGGGWGEPNEERMYRNTRDYYSTIFSVVRGVEKPIIASLNGVAAGAGQSLALACDLRIAAEHAVFGLPEPSLGIIPGAGGTQRLPRIVGLGRAKEMILTGARWDARRALEYGLVSEVVPGPDLLKAARAMAERVLTLGPLAVRLAKSALNASSQMPLAAGLVFESTAQAITFESADKQEGTTAFLEKRKPRFKGE
jgi:enoyl-CoA hydratase/carnithine racemase